MEKIFKVIPLALGLLTLASCSSEDFFGNAAIKGKKELIVSMESSDGMRAAFTADANMAATWQTTDEFRVYDEALQRYDAFKYNGSAIVFEGTEEKAAPHKKVIFPGDQVYYAGWDAANDAVTAVMEVPTYVTYGGPLVNGDVVSYVSCLPQWGDVKNETSEKLEVDLKHLAARTNITVYNDIPVTGIRIFAADGTYDNATGKEQHVKELTLDPKTPLSGFFEAELTTDGELVANLNNPVVKDSYKSYVVVNMTTNKAEEAHVLVPIIPDVTYKQLVIEYTTDPADDDYDGAEWTFLKEYKNQSFTRTQILRLGNVIGNEPSESEVETFEEITKYLAAAANMSTFKGVLNMKIISESKTLATSVGSNTTDVTAGQTIELPKTAPAGGYSTMVVNITDGSIINKTANRPMRITGGVAGVDVILNFVNGIDGTENIIVDLESGAGSLTLAGEMKGAGKILDIQGGDVTLGRGNLAPFSTNMNIAVADGTLTVDAENGNTIAAIDAYNCQEDEVAPSSATITINSGSVTAIGSVCPGDGAVTVNGGTVKTIATKGGKITLDADAATESVTTETTNGVTIKSDVKTLNLNAATTLDVTGGSAAGAKSAIITTLNLNSKLANGAVTVTSEGKAAIVTVTNNGKASFTSSTWNGKKAHIAVAQNDGANIYTAAQLGGMDGSKAMKLMTPVTISGEWTPVNISSNFDGNSKTITGLNAALFGTVKNSEIKKLTLSGVTITDDSADQGALARIVEGATVTEVEVIDLEIKAKNAKKTSNVNIGGLIGRAKGTVTLLNNKVATKSSATIGGYANVGGYIGNFEGGTLKMSAKRKDDTTTDWVSQVKFAQTYDNVEETNTKLFGTFGYFVGSITNAGSSVSIVTYDKNGAEIDENAANKSTIKDYFNNESDYALNKSSLHFDYNVNDDEEEFVGGHDNEFGYAKVDAITYLMFYNQKRDELGKYIPYTILDDVNIYE